MATRNLYCPVCNAQGTKNPVLSPMVVSRVVMAPMDKPEHTRPPYYCYRCDRCGFAEIHERRIDAA